MVFKNKIHVLRPRATATADAIWGSVEDSEQAEKDAHLLVAAISTDRIVVSRDDTAKQYLVERCREIAGVCEVMWVCPEHETGVVGWLCEGAPEKEQWLLCRAEGGHEQ